MPCLCHMEIAMNWSEIEGNWKEIKGKAKQAWGKLTDRREIFLLAGGHMVNLGGPRPLGNSIESMDLGFALQARCLEAVARGRCGPTDVVVPVPSAINAVVAEAFLTMYR